MAKKRTRSREGNAPKGAKNKGAKDASAKAPAKDDVAGDGALRESAEAEPAESESTESEREPTMSERETPGEAIEEAIANEEAHHHKMAVPAYGAPKSDPATEAPRPQLAWGLPFVRIEKAWTWFEARFLFVLLVMLVVALVVWISFNGMASPLNTGNSAGTVFRMMLGGALAGLLARIATRKRLEETPRAIATTVAVVAGIAAAPLWRETGVEGWGRALNWLQEGSTLTLFGGLRGVGTRLTLLVALVGASLAAATGKHINIDVVLRFLKPKLRLPVFLLGAVSTAAVCFFASWGFFDYISIEGFGLAREATATEKVATVREEVGQHFFIWRKQLGLDMGALPKVVTGERWDDPTRMNGRAWNEMINEGGFRDHFTKEEVDAILAPDTALEEPRVPFVVMPGKSARGLLIDSMNLMFPVGFFMIGLRFLLRALLVVAGFATIEPDPDESSDEGEDAAAEGAAEAKEVA